jgi:NitT/TauT family transport system substrate-binding protein
MRSFAACLFTALTLAVGVAQAQSTDTVRIQDYPGLGNLLGRVAVAYKFCEKHGIHCEMKTVPSAPLGMQMLLAGDLEVQVGAQEVLVNAIAKGAHIKVIGVVHGTPMTFLAASSRLATPNQRKGFPAVMQDLRGKRIGVPVRGAGPEFQLASLLKAAGLSLNDVTLVAVGSPDTALPALRNGQVDAVMLFEPMGGFCAVLKVCHILVDLRKGQGTPDVLVKGANTTMVVTAAYAEKKPATVAAIRASFRDAEAFVQNPANRPAVLKVLRDTFNISIPNSDEVLSVVLKDSLPALTTTFYPKSLQEVADNMLRTGQIDKHVDTSVVLISPNP